jgi:hypothetical protein
LSRRKDLERFERLKDRNPDYTGFRGVETVTEKPPPALESVVCSVCLRKRNVDADALPEDRSSYVCLNCQEAELPEGR